LNYRKSCSDIDVGLQLKPVEITEVHLPIVLSI